MRVHVCIQLRPVMRQYACGSREAIVKFQLGRAKKVNIKTLLFSYVIFFFLESLRLFMSREIKAMFRLIVRAFNGTSYSPEFFNSLPAEMISPRSFLIPVFFFQPAQGHINFILQECSACTSTAKPNCPGIEHDTTYACTG